MSEVVCCVWLFEDCGGKLYLCVYLCCVIQEMPGRDDPVWNGIVCWVHCVGFIVCCDVLCDCGRCVLCFMDV